MFCCNRFGRCNNCCSCSCRRNSRCGSCCDFDEDDSVTSGGSSLSRFPVYVSFPSFFVGDRAIVGANRAIFQTDLSGTV